MENCIEKFIVRDFENAFVAFWPIEYRDWNIGTQTIFLLWCHIKNYVRVVATATKTRTTTDGGGGAAANTALVSLTPSCKPPFNR